MAPSRGNFDNYMASVQSLSALTDDPTVTSFPLSAGTPAQFQCVSPTVGFYDLQGQSQTTAHGLYMESSRANQYSVPPYWQYNGLAQAHWNVNGGIDDAHDWFKYRPHHHAQQYNRLSRQTESPSWHRGWSVRYHPYATAGAATNSVGVGPLSWTSTAYLNVCDGVDQRAPAYIAQSNYYLPTDANHNGIRQVASGAAQPAYVAYPATQADYVTAACGNYQISA